MNTTLMTMPALILGFFLSTLYGALFHLWRGGGAGRLLLDLILAWAGFWAGNWIAAQLDLALLNWIAAQLDLALLKIGPLYAGPATLLAWLVLILGHWLSQVPGKTA
jgi:hypothetical protein